MKNILLIFIFSFFIISCSKEENQMIMTQNATIFYDPSIIDNCKYTIKTESNNFYAVKILDEMFRENNLKVKISYFITDEKMNCGFSNNMFIIQIKTIERI